MSAAAATDPILDVERLRALDESSGVGSPTSSAIDRCVRIAGEATRAAVVLVSLVDTRRQFFFAHRGLGEPWASRRETPHSHSFCQHVVRSGDALIVSDARLDARVCDNLAIPDLGVVAYAGMPIVTDDGHTLGSFCAIDTQARTWTEGELAILRDLAALVSGEFDLRRRLARAEQGEAQLSHLHQRLRQRLDRAQRSTASTAHDLRTPLSVISMGIDSMLMNPQFQGSPQAVVVLDMLRRNLQQASALVESAVDSQTEAPFAGARTDLVPLVGAVCEDLCAIRPDVSLRTNVDGDHFWVMGTDHELRRCIENLVGNALRFANTTVVVGLSQLDDRICLSVDDDGDGLPAHAYATLWHWGARFHAERGLSRTGHGLAITRELVTDANGSVDAMPSALGGARFELLFPELRDSRKHVRNSNSA